MDEATFYTKLKMLLSMHDCTLTSGIWRVEQSPRMGTVGALLVGFTYRYLTTGINEFVEFFISGDNLMSISDVCGDKTYKYGLVERSKYRFTQLPSRHRRKVLEFIKQHANTILA